MKIKIFSGEILKKVNLKSLVKTVAIGTVSLALIGSLVSYSNNYPENHSNYNDVINVGEEVKEESPTSSTSVSLEDLYAYSNDQDPTRDISEDYSYKYVGNKDGVISVNSEDYVEYKNTDNAFTRTKSTLEDNPVDINPEQLDEFNKYLEKYHVDIPYSDFFNIPALLKKQGEFKEITGHGQKLSLIDGKIDLEELYRNVKDNNSAYPSANLISLSDDELHSICELIVKVLNDEISSNPYLNGDATLCTLSDLKIFGEENVTNARISLDYVLAINKTMIANLQNTLDGDTDAYKLTIIHEIEHIPQLTCKHEVANKLDEDRIGFQHKWASEPINSVFWKWYFEASAETLQTNSTGEDNIVYENPTNYIKYLKMTCLPNPSFDVYSLERVSVSRNPDDFYSIFGITEEKDKIELAEIMYAIELIQNEDPSFAKIYKSQKGKNSSTIAKDEWISIKRELKTGLAINLSRMFYSNLVKYVQTGRATLNDVYRLITLYESEIESHITYDSIERFEANSPFMEAYLEIQDAFFSILSTQKGYSYDEIKDGFMRYSYEDKNDFDGLPDSSVAFIKVRQKELIKHTTTNISTTSTKLKKQKTLVLD